MRRIILLLALAPILSAAPREWKDPGSPRTMLADFLSRDAKGVTVLRTDGRRVVIANAKLHPDDLAWLNTHHPLPGTKPTPPQGPTTPPTKDMVFDTLKFGDTRQEVTAKLKASKFVELTMDETYLGRMGLNGSFRTRKDIGGLRCLLFFDWSEDGKLIEVSLQTSPLPAADYPTRVKACWTDLAALITSMHGKPLQAAGYPAANQLTEGASLSSHLWRMETGGSVMLGTARDTDGFTTVVRFTKREVSPVTTPTMAP